MMLNTKLYATNYRRQLIAETEDSVDSSKAGEHHEDSGELHGGVELVDDAGSDGSLLSPNDCTGELGSFKPDSKGAQTYLWEHFHPSKKDEICVDI